MPVHAVIPATIADIHTPLRHIGPSRRATQHGPSSSRGVSYGATSSTSGSPNSSLGKGKGPASQVEDGLSDFGDGDDDGLEPVVGGT